MRVSWTCVGWMCGNRMVLRVFACVGRRLRREILMRVGLVLFASQPDVGFRFGSVRTTFHLTCRGGVECGLSLDRSLGGVG